MMQTNDEIHKKLQANVLKCLDYLIERAKSVKDEYKGFDVPWRRGYVNVWKNSYKHPQLVKITIQKPTYHDVKRDEMYCFDEDDCCDFLEGWEQMKRNFDKMIVENDMRNERTRKYAEDFHV